jgi:energy-converting hydrogenase Eha subunit H
MKKFIVIQLQVNLESTPYNVLMSNVVRQVEAESKEIAIGKFVVATQEIKAQKKMNIECYDLSELRKL